MSAPNPNLPNPDQFFADELAECYSTNDDWVDCYIVRHSPGCYCRHHYDIRIPRGYLSGVPDALIRKKLKQPDYIPESVRSIWQDGKTDLLDLGDGADPTWKD